MPAPTLLYLPGELEERLQQFVSYDNLNATMNLWIT